MAHLGNEDRQFFSLTYVSLITLTTMGYADLMPASPLARSLTVVEAGLGQFYLAVLVAEIVGKRMAQGAAPPLTRGAGPLLLS